MRFRYSTEENGRLVRKAAVYTGEEHRINFSDVDKEAVYITERLQANGYETYIVGGAVRDLIVGKKPKDFDIVTAASPAKIKKIFRNARIIGRRFRLVHVFFGPKIFEVSTFRSMKDGPTSNTFGTIEEDVQRRDFSLNALFYDPQKQIVIDYVGGMKDIRRGLIRPIIALQHIFTDDPVRMIRAVKYGAAVGFKLPLSLKWKIRKQSGLLADVSPSRLTEEIFKIIHSPKILEIVEGLDAMGLYRYLQPRAAELFKSAPGFRARYFKTLGALHGELPAPAAASSAGAVSGERKLPPGEALAALIRDYLEDNADWDGKKEGVEDEAPPPESKNPGGGGPGAEDGKEPSGDNGGVLSPSERYKNVFILARKFVLPMNPPRMELEAALRLLFAEHGVAVKKTRRGEYSRRSGPEDGGTEKNADSKRRGAPASRRGTPARQGVKSPPGVKAAEEKPPNSPVPEDGGTPPRRRRNRKRKTPPGKETTVEPADFNPAD